MPARPMPRAAAMRNAPGRANAMAAERPARHPQYNASANAMAAQRAAAMQNRTAASRASAAAIRAQNARAQNMAVRNANRQNAALRNQAVANRQARQLNNARTAQLQRQQQLQRNQRNARFAAANGAHASRTRSHRRVAVTNNWKSSKFSGRNYAAFRDYRRERHDRNWWRSHYNRITFRNGGWYYWDTGYWYPAVGYDPGYVYPYYGPIYSYNNLAPDEVIASVQSRLDGAGYDAGPVDGSLGPLTREALAAFQYDQGLAVTSAIDQPTLAALGLI